MALQGAEGYFDTDSWHEISQEHGQRFTTRDRELWVVSRVFQRDGKHVTTKGEDHVHVNLFFVHGGGGRAQQWEPILQDLEKKLSNVSKPIVIHAHAINLIGHGRSSKPIDPDEYQFLYLVEDVEDFMSAVDVGSYVPRSVQDSKINVPKSKFNIMVGHSLGSGISMHVSERKKVKVDGIVLISTSFERPKSSDSGIWNCCICCLECMRPLFKVLTPKDMFFHPSISPDFVAEQERISSQNPFSMFAPLIRQVVWPTASQMRNITQDTLIIQPDTDNIFPDDIKLLQQAIVDTTMKPNQTVNLEIINQSGHNVISEQPAVVLGHIWNHVSDICLK